MVAEQVYIGVDPTAGKGLFAYAMLDERLNVVAAEDTDIDGLLQVAREFPAVVCAIGAPGGPNMNLMAEPDYRQRLGLPPDSKTYSTFRVCEYELRRRKIGLHRTPPDSHDASDWMKSGWRLNAALREAGYVSYPQSGERQVFEVHAHACFTVLLGKRPYNKDSFEGRLQRHLLLYEQGLNIDDPMEVMEEWTRHRVLTGGLAADGLLFENAGLDALVAAYTAFLLVEEPGSTSRVGDADEGQIVLPVADLQENYG